MTKYALGALVALPFLALAFASTREPEPTRTVMNPQNELYDMMDRITYNMATNTDELTTVTVRLTSLTHKE